MSWSEARRGTEVDGADHYSPTRRKHLTWDGESADRGFRHRAARVVHLRSYLAQSRAVRRL